MKPYLKILRRYFLLNLEAALEYRKSFLIQAFGMVLNNAVMIFFWAILFNRFGETFASNRISFNEIMLLFALASSSFGVFNIFMGGAQRLSAIIIDGQLDVFLLYPKDPFFMSLISKSSVYAWGDLLFGCLLALVVLPKSLPPLLLFAYFSVIAAVVLASFSVLLNSLTFYFGNAQEIHRTGLMGLMSFSSYPENMFPPKAKLLLFSLLPVGFYLYLPVRALLNFDLKIFMLSTFSAALFLLAAYLVFMRGLRRFESGNLIYSTK